MNTRSVRIKDIAQLSGVSVGTVDRVLHNRGKVSEDALKKVLKVLDQIDYKPNVIARTLGSNRAYRIAVLMPNPEQDPYWAATSEGRLTVQRCLPHGHVQLYARAHCITCRGELEWVERTGGTEVVHRVEPGTTLLKRIGVGVLSWLPIEWLL